MSSANVGGKKRAYLKTLMPGEEKGAAPKDKGGGGKKKIKKESRTFTELANLTSRRGPWEVRGDGKDRLGLKKGTQRRERGGFLQFSEKRGAHSLKANQLPLRHREKYTATGKVERWETGRKGGRKESSKLATGERDHRPSAERGRNATWERQWAVKIDPDAKKEKRKKKDGEVENGLPITPLDPQELYEGVNRAKEGGFIEDASRGEPKSEKIAQATVTLSRLCKILSARGPGKERSLSIRDTRERGNSQGGRARAFA